MTTRAVIAVAVFFALSACPQQPAPDGGSGGGSATGGGGGGGGDGGDGGGGGAATGGGQAAPFDAGHLDCTFEPAFELGDVTDNARAQVAVTASGHALYAWNGPGGLTWAVQTPEGVLQGPTSTPGNTLTDSSLVASGDRALLVYAAASAQLYENRFTSESGFMAPGVVTVTPLTGLTASFVALEPSGAASVWVQQAGFTSAFDEFTTDGAAAFTGPREVVDAGFFYAATRTNGRRLVISLPEFTATAVPEVVISTGGGDQRTPLTGAMVTGNDYFHGAIAEDGTAVVAGLFSLGGVDGLGALVGGGGAFGAAELVTPLPAGGVAMLRSLAALAGPDGRAAVVWWQEDALYLSKRTGGAWAAPVSLAAAPGVVPRFTKVGASRGFAHFYDATGTARMLEVTVDGATGASFESELSGATYGTEYAAGGAKAAAIAIEFAADGGYLLRAAQCR